MEHPETAISAEVEIDNAELQQERSRRRTSRKSESPGRTKATLSAGLAEQDEEARLLSASDGYTRPHSDEPPGYNGDFAHLPWYKRPSIYWMLGPFMLMTIAFGGIVTPKVNLYLDLICREYMHDRHLADPSFVLIPVDFNGGDNDQCRIPEVQSRVSLFTLWGGLLTGLASGIVSPRLGALSDLYGRRPILMISSIGTMLAEIITICAATYPETISVNWLLLSFALDGLSGSFLLAMAMANSYATDCTPPHRRNVAFGYFHGCLFTGLAIGPILAGYIVKWTGRLVIVFYIMLAVHLFFVTFIGLVVPESLSKRRRDIAREKASLKLLASGNDDMSWIPKVRKLNLLEPLRILCPTGPGSSPELRRNLLVLAAVDTIMFGVAMGSITVLLIYVNYQFGWKTFESSRFMTIVNSARVFCLIVVLPTITRLVLGKQSSRSKQAKGSDNFDLYTIRIGILFDTLGYVGYSLARKGEFFILSGVVAALGGVASPALQSALTKHVPEDKTGQLLGATGLLHSLARVVAPTVFNAIYAATVGTFTQTVYVCLAATFGLAFVISWFVRPHVYYDEDEAIASMRDSLPENLPPTTEPSSHIPIVSAITATFGSFLVLVGLQASS